MIEYIALIISILLLTVAPILIIGYLIKEKNYRFLPFVFGMLAFLTSQLILRIPLLAVTGWINGSVLFLAFTAALFEEPSRFIFGKTLLKDKLSLKTAISFGLGHAFCEIISLVVLAQVNSLILMFMIDSGFELSILGLNSEEIIQVIASIENINVIGIILAFFERISATLIHISLTIIVFYGIFQKKSIFYLLVAILIHTAFNFSLIMLLGVNVYLMEIAALIFSSCLVYMVVKRFNFVNNDNLEEVL